MTDVVQLMIFSVLTHRAIIDLDDSEERLPHLQRDRISCRCIHLKTRHYIRDTVRQKLTKNLTERTIYLRRINYLMRTH
jgi:hypothetical protein